MGLADSECVVGNGSEYPLPSRLGGLWGIIAPPVGSETEPRPKTVLVHFCRRKVAFDE